jgi:hypothetical protein
VRCEQDTQRYETIVKLKLRPDLQHPNSRFGGRHEPFAKREKRRVELLVNGGKSFRRSI